MFKEAVTRVNNILRTGASLDKAARFINAEFPMTAYVSKGKLWTQFTEDGKVVVRVMA